MPVTSPESPTGICAPDVSTILIAFTDWDHIARCVRSRSATTEMLELAMTHPNPLIRAQAAHQLQDRSDMMRLAASDPRFEVREVAAASTGLRASELANFTQDRAISPRVAAAANPRLAPQHRATMLEDPCVDVRRMAARGELPHDVRQQIPEHSCEAVRISTASYGSLDEDLERRLAHDDSRWVRYGIARRCTSPELLTILASDPVAEVQHQVALNICSPAPALAITARSPDREVRRSTMTNPSMTSEIAAELARHPDAVTRRDLARATTDGDVLETLAHDSALDVRLAVAENPETPSRLLAELASARSWRMRLVLARRDDIDPALASILTQELLCDHRQYVRTETRLAGLGPTPVPSTAPIDHCDRQAVLAAVDAGCPIEHVVHIIQRREADLVTRLVVLTHPDVPVEVLDTASRDPKAEIRAAVARHWSCPQRTLRRLRSDRCEWVGATARWALSNRRLFA